MKWTKEYVGSVSNPSIVYVSGEYRIRRTQSKNIWTGRVMSAQNQVWNIFKNGAKVDYAFTLKEAKAIAEKLA